MTTKLLLGAASILFPLMVTVSQGDMTIGAYLFEIAIIVALFTDENHSH